MHYTVQKQKEGIGQLLAKGNAKDKQKASLRINEAGSLLPAERDLNQVLYKSIILFVGTIVNISIDNVRQSES